MTKVLDYQVGMCRGLWETQWTSCSVLGSDPMSRLGLGERNVTSKGSESSGTARKTRDWVTGEERDHQPR